MKRISAVSTLAIIIISISSLVMFGWKFHITMLINVMPQQINMVFNTALCFFISGVTLLLPETGMTSKKLAYKIGGILLGLIAGLILSQDLFGYSVGIDHLFSNVWQLDHNPYPGRMASNTAISFCLTAFVFLLYEKSNNRLVAMAVQLAIIGIGFLGISALLGYILNLEILYGWYRYTRMAIHTSLTFSLLSLALWLAWKDSLYFKNFYKNKDDKKILLLATIILFGIASISVLLGFVISEKQDEVSMTQFLNESVEEKTTALQHSIYKTIGDIEILKNDPTFKKLVSNTNSHIDYKSIDEMFINASFSAIRIYDSSNKILYSAGNFVDKPKVIIPLNLPYAAKIIWDRNFFLQLTSEIKTDSQTKYLQVEWPINAVNEILTVKKQAITKEFFLCYVTTDNQPACLPPSSSNSLLGTLSANESKNLVTAILSGQEISIKNNDSREDKILLTYKPVDKLHIGLIIKTDLGVIYKPIFYRLLIVIIILCLAVFIGSLLLNWMISPLVNKMVENEKKFRLAFENSAIGMAIVSLNGSWIQVNSALCQILGYNEDEFLQKNYEMITHSDDVKSTQLKIHQLLIGKSNNCRFEQRYLHKDGHIVWALLNISLIRDAMENPLHLITQTQDITVQKEIEIQLHYQARHDALTGLVNRIELEDKMQQIILSSKRNKEKFAVFFLDLDKFKQINDSLGHDAGDRLLKIIAERLKSCSRKSDVICRLGGDEFVLVLTDLQEYKPAALFAERVMGILGQAINIKGHELFITTSLGISFFPIDGTSPDTLIKNADNALYRAKESGKNNYQFCEQEVSIQVREKMAFETDLKNAIESNEFKIHYMPQINPVYNSIVGFEGFLRWESSQYGFLMPQQILPIAEESGLIIPLSEWIIKTAGTEIKQWQQNGFPHLRLAINISARHFMHELLIDSITDGLQLAGFDSDCFMLEINESLIMQDPKRTTDIINVLKRLGIKILIDNFGTGYSSLTHLQDFAVDFIKIDRSIVQEITTEPKRAELVAAMISLAKNLGIKTIAEGVETREQCEFLLERGCDELQGYYIGKPIAADALGELLLKQRSELDA